MNVGIIGDHFVRVYADDDGLVASLCEDCDEPGARVHTVRLTASGGLRYSDHIPPGYMRRVRVMLRTIAGDLERRGYVNADTVLKARAALRGDMRTLQGKEEKNV